MEGVDIFDLIMDGRCSVLLRLDPSTRTDTLAPASASAFTKRAAYWYDCVSNNSVPE
jgi:hypothetical protein